MVTNLAPLIPAWPPRPDLIRLAALALSLAACNPTGSGPPPLSEQALAAVAPESGAPRVALARAIDSLFGDADLGETRAVLILHDGRIVAERYAPGYGPATRFAGWSMASSVTGALIGLLVSDGRLKLDQPVPIPAWQRPGDPRGEITLHELLQMRSGLANQETGPARASDTMRMLFLDGRDDMAGYAEAQPLEAEPGRQWRYSTATAVILADLAARTLTDSTRPDDRRRAIAEYLRTRLTEPLGLPSMVAEYDAAGTLIGGGMMHATARDWGHFGEFLRNVGSVRGTQVVPRDWIRFMTEPSPANPGYGAMVWLNHPQPDGRQVLFPGHGPDSLFACVGQLGQYVLISPDQHLTIVRLGETADAQAANLRGRLGEIVELFQPGAPGGE